MKRNLGPVFIIGKRMLLLLMFLALPPALHAEVDKAKELGIYLAQHGYGTMEVDMEGINDQSVEAKINGKSVTLVIDTGCTRTCLTASCARHLKLNVRDTGHEDWAVGGSLKGDTGAALINSFTLNNHEINRTNIIYVLPPSVHMINAQGLLGLDVLKLNAVILPIHADRLLFKPGNAPPPSIGNYMNVLGFKPIPLEYVRGDLRIEGHLDGQPFSAVLDCGAAFTTFDLDYVHKCSEKFIPWQNVILQGLDGAPEVTYGFMPKQLSFGPLSVKPMILGAGTAAVFKHGGINVLLGYDFLATHHAIIDLGHDTLWMQ